MRRREFIVLMGASVAWPGWRVWPSRYLHWPGDGSARGMNPAPAPPAQGVLSTEARIRPARDARAPDLRPCEHVADYFAYQ
jgi:hypothetical protein